MDLPHRALLQLPHLRAGLYLHVAENKSLPGREERPADEAVGRPLAAAWFEEVLGNAASPLLRRADRTSTSLATQLQTVAEVLLAAGAELPAMGANASSKDKELALEELYATEPRFEWQSEQVWEEADPWTFTLSNPQPAEESFLEATPLDSHTKMALARLLELRTGADRRRSSKAKKEVLRMWLQEQ